MSDIVGRLVEAYDKVKEWPENNETGFMDLLSLRNLVPEAKDEIVRLRSELANARNAALEEAAEFFDRDSSYGKWHSSRVASHLRALKAEGESR